jgi:hypothetical protein
MESEELNGGRFVTKSMEIEGHKGVRISNGSKIPWGQ